MTLVIDVRALLFTLVTLLLPALSLGAEPEKTQAMKEYIKSLDSPVELRGDFFKAAMSAYQKDFSKHMEPPKKQVPSDAQGQDKFSLSDFLSRLENYDLLIERKGDNYSVSFGPTVRGDALEIFGGGAQYLIDGRTFEIIDKKYTK